MLVLRGEEGGELVGLGGGIDEAVELEGGIAEQARDDGHVGLADELVGHEDAAYAVLVRDVDLVRSGESDAPGAAVKLEMEELRGHAGFAVRRELDVVSFDEAAHPVLVVEELVAIEDGGGEGEVFAEEVPVEGGDFDAREVAIEVAEAFVEGADEGGGCTHLDS